jgi:hypothetical protein
VHPSCGRKSTSTRVLSEDYRRDVAHEECNFRRKSVRRFWAVSVAVLKVHTESTRMRIPSVWRYCAYQQLHNIAREVMCLVTVLFSHQISDVVSIDSPNNGQHDISCADLLLDFLRDISARYASFHRMMKFQSKPTLIASDKSSNFLRSRKRKDSV